jgi:hypothetical protein
LNPDGSIIFPGSGGASTGGHLTYSLWAQRKRRFLEKGHGLNPPFPEENHWNSDLDGIFMGSEGDFDGI